MVCQWSLQLHPVFQFRQAVRIQLVVTRCRNQTRYRIARGRRTRSTRHLVRFADRSAWEQDILNRRISRECVKLFALAIPLKHCVDLGFDRLTRPWLRILAGIKNGFPPMVKVTEGKVKHGTTGSQSKVPNSIETHRCTSPSGLAGMARRQTPGARPKLAADHHK
jgi:hypothetical protein